MVFQPTWLNAFLGGIGPFHLRSVYKKTFASTDAFDPLALVPLGMSPLASFLPFYLPFFFTHPPLAPLPRGGVKYGDLRDLILQRHCLNSERPNCRPFAHSCQPVCGTDPNHVPSTLGPLSELPRQFLKEIPPQVMGPSSSLFFFSAPRLLPIASRSESESTSAWADHVILSQNDTSKKPSP
jgi:hypothetical protein